MAVGAAIGGVALGAVSSYNSNKNAGKAIDQQGSSIAAQNAIAQQQMNMAQEQYEYYKSTYLPLEQEIVNDAGINETEQHEMVAAAGLTASNSFDSAIQQRDRNLQRMGINPNSGAYASNTRKNAISKAVAKANSQNQARASAKLQDSAERTAMVGLGKGMPSAVGGLMNSASSNYANQANAYANQANMYGKQASGGMQLGMGVAGAAMGAYDDDGKFNSTAFGKGLLGVI